MTSVQLRRVVPTITLFLVVATGCQATRSSHVTSAAPVTAPAWSVCFSPRGGCTDLIVHTIQQARTEILVQAYSFTSEPIAQALVAAHQRGVRVDAILDKSQQTEDDSRAPLLRTHGVPVRIDKAHAIAHNKVIVIDSRIVITGSFNFTKGAEERNAENLLVIQDATLATRYRQNWERHEQHAVSFR